MDSLYFLSLLLTGSQAKAEQCFVAGLENSLESNPVFAKWAYSWAKQTVIRNAVRLLHPRPIGIEVTSAMDSAEESSWAAFESTYFQIGRVLAIEAFQRFAFVLSVLEQYSDYECALFLGSSSKEIRIARAMAIQQVFHSQATSKEQWRWKAPAAVSATAVRHGNAEEKVVN